MSPHSVKKSPVNASAAERHPVVAWAFGPVASTAPSGTSRQRRKTSTRNVIALTRETTSGGRWPIRPPSATAASIFRATATLAPTRSGGSRCRGASEPIVKSVLSPSTSARSTVVYAVPRTRPLAITSALYRGAEVCGGRDGGRAPTGLEEGASVTAVVGELAPQVASTAASLALSASSSLACAW